MLPSKRARYDDDRAIDDLEHKDDVKRDVRTTDCVLLELSDDCLLSVLECTDQ